MCLPRTEHRNGLFRPLQARIHFVPIDVSEECVDILRRRCAIVHLVRMLIHVQDEQRLSKGNRLRVIAGPIGAQLSSLKIVIEKGPPTASAQAHPSRSKQLLPPTEASALSGEALFDATTRLPISAQIAEVVLVQNHGVCEGELSLL